MTKCYKILRFAQGVHIFSHDCMQKMMQAKICSGVRKPHLLYNFLIQKTVYWHKNIIFLWENPKISLQVGSGETVNRLLFDSSMVCVCVCVAL